MRLYVAIALAGMAATSAARADLVTNGGFETGDLTGWNSGGNLGFTGVNSNPNVHSGDFAFDMGPVGSDGFINQTIATTASQSYRFSFWLDNDGGTPNDFQASWNGVAQLGLVDADGFGYTHYVYNVVATGASTTIEFDFRQDPAWFHLDDVSVRPECNVVPLPPAAAMGVGGMAGIGLIGAIRRRRAVRG